MKHYKIKMSYDRYDQIHLASVMGWYDTGKTKKEAIQNVCKSFFEWRDGLSDGELHDLLTNTECDCKDEYLFYNFYIDEVLGYIHGKSCKICGNFIADKENQQ